MLAGVGSPRSIQRRDIRPFHVYAGNGRVCVPYDGSCTARESLKRRGDKGGEQPGNAGGPEGLYRMMQLIRCAAGIVKVYSCKAVDLQIEKAWRFDSHCRKAAGPKGRWPAGQFLSGRSCSFVTSSVSEPYLAMVSGFSNRAECRSRNTLVLP